MPTMSYLKKELRKWFLVFFFEIASKINQILAIDLIKEEKKL